MRATIQERLQKSSAALRAFAALALVWLTAMLIMSTWEYFSHASSLDRHDRGGSLLGYKLLHDLAFWIEAYLIVLLVFTVLYHLSRRLAIWVAAILIVVLVIGQAALLKYFSSALVPLGADLYAYSFSDIAQTTGASGSLHVTDLLIFGVFIFLLVAGLRLATRKSLLPRAVALVLPCLSLVALILSIDGRLAARTFASEFDTNLSLNKLDFFLARSYDHFFPEEEGPDIYADYYGGGQEDKGSLTSAFQYPDPTHYPFYHGDSTRDVLSPFFMIPVPGPSALTRPDIVIILVEGLGRAFTNAGAYLGNFTPFLDSLSAKSLYWQNFLSEGGRTFAVLPSILGSVPFGKNGFLELGAGMPDHLSLLEVLKASGYRSSFYYGGDAHFDNMDLFLHKERIDELNDERSFPAGYTKLPAQNGFSWGYNDGELFRRYLDTRPDRHDQPQCSIVLTVSTHSPFAINEPALYAGKFENRMDQLGLDNAARSDRREYKAQYSSILYADDALRGFFSAYAKRADYANTIFIITGDHRMPEIPMRTKIDRYHVPMIIFSPMLKRTATIRSISTHFDLTPSLLAFLHQSYGLHTPPAAQWMGSGLDTERVFRNIHAYPLMQTKTDLLDFVEGNFHLNGSQLFRLSEDMNEVPLAADSNQAGLDSRFTSFLRKNEKIVSGARLIPDSALLPFRH